MQVSLSVVVLMTPSSDIAKVATSSIDVPRPSTRLHALNGSALSASAIPSSRTSTYFPSKSLNSDDVNSFRSTKNLDDSTLEVQPPGRPNKRKRDSELHKGNSSQLKEAQDMVEQKRAKIAARVPSGNTGLPSQRVTSLADLYARLHRDSGASPQSDASNVPLTPVTPKTGPPNRQPLSHLPRSSSPDHSSASSPDPIALTEDDQDIILVKHIRPNPSQAHSPSKTMSRLINLAHLSQSLKRKPSVSTPTPNGVHLNGVAKSPDKPRKPLLDFAVVVDSPPPKYAKQKPKDASRSRGYSEVASNKIIDSKRPKAITLDTPSPAPLSRTRTTEAVTDSAPEQGSRRSRRAVGYLNGSSLTSQDIDELLGATPVPFDLTVPRVPVASGDGDGDDSMDKTLLWWDHPIFLARVKTDIRRTLRLSLPEDRAHDPPPPIGESAGRWRAEVRPRQTRARMWTERLEDAFGPGAPDRGLGRKPRRLAVSPPFQLRTHSLRSRTPG